MLVMLAKTLLILIATTLVGQSSYGEPNASLRVDCSPCRLIGNEHKTECEVELRGTDGSVYVGQRMTGVGVPDRNEFTRLTCQGARDWAMEFDRTLFEIPNLERLESIGVRVDVGGLCMYSADRPTGPYSIDRSEDHLYLATDFEDFYSPMGRKAFSESLPACDPNSLACVLESELILKYYCLATDFILDDINGWELTRSTR